MVPYQAPGTVLVTTMPGWPQPRSVNRDGIGFQIGTGLQLIEPVRTGRETELDLPVVPPAWEAFW
jgi:hypothetical protein